MKNRMNFKVLTLLMMLAASSQTFAQDEFEKVEVLDHPRYTLNRRVVLDAEFSYLPLDAYFKPVLIDIAASYQFADFLTWEVVRAGFPIYKHDTGLNSQIENVVRDRTNDPTLELVTSKEMKDLRYKLGSTLFANLLYSKSNFFNRGVVYHYWQAGVGPSFWDFKSEKQYGADFVLRARFFLNENFMLNLRAVHTVGFSSKAPSNIIQLGIGGGFAF